MQNKTIAHVIGFFTVVGQIAVAQPHFEVPVDSLMRLLHGPARDSVIFYVRNTGTAPGTFTARAIMFPRSSKVASMTNPARETHQIQINYPNDSVPSSVSYAVNDDGVLSTNNHSTSKREPTRSVTGALTSNSYGYDYRTSNWTSFDVAQPDTLFPLGTFSPSDAIYAGDFTLDGSRFIAVKNATNQLIDVNITNGTYTVIGPVTIDAGHTWTSAKFDPTSGAFYAVSTNITVSSLYTIDPGTGTTTRIATITNMPAIIGMAIQGGTGQMYGYDIVTDNFVSIDKATGATTVIGPIGFNANLAQDMAFDRQSGTLYMAAYNGNLGHAELRTVNTTTGATTLVGQIGTDAHLIDPFSIQGSIIPGSNWLSIVPTNGTINPGDSLRFTTGFDATDPFIYNNPGDYYGSIDLTALETPDTLKIPVRMRVDTREIMLIAEPDSVNIGDVLIGTTDSSKSFLARNIGASPVIVTGISFTDSALDASPTSFVLQSLDTVRIHVRFTASPPPSVHSGVLHFISNDPLASQVGLRARSVGPSITIISPNGGEIWYPGETHYLIWREVGVDTVRVEFSQSGSPGPWYLLHTGYTGSDSMRFVVSATPSNHCFFRVSLISNPAVSDTNDGPFTIAGQVSHWHAQTSGTTVPLYAVKTVDNNIAWAGGGTGAGTSGIVRRTTDGGATWTFAGSFPADVYCMTALDANKAIAGTWTGTFARLMKTTDGGTTWWTVDSVAGGFYNAIEMNSPTNGIALGDPIAGNWLVRRTTNGGDTWFNGPTTPWTGSETMWSNCMMWYDSLHGWFFTSPGSIYRTTDGASSWSRTTPPASPGPVWFNQLSSGLSGPRLRSSDAGATWALTSGIIPEAVTALSGSAGLQMFWAAAGNDVYVSSDAGDSWSNEAPFGYTGAIQLNHISMIHVGSITAGWAVGGGGTIVRFIAGEDDVKENPGVIPKELSLAQNYPNPFNPSTNFQFSIAHSQLTILKVYDLLGREVATLVNEVRPPGRYQITWDAGKAASGVYFYQLMTGSVFLQRKMLLVR